MKVMFTCFAHNTHYYSLVPMAWALRTAGHEVRVLSQPDLTETINSSGLTAMPVGTRGWADSDPLAPELFEAIYQAGTRHVQHFDFAKNDPQQWTWQSLLCLENVMVAAPLLAMVLLA